MRKALYILGGLVMLAVLVAGGGVLWVFWQYGRGLPDTRHLAVYEPPVASRIYAGDGSLLAEFATERRVFVPFSAVPRGVIDAFVSAEDKTFFSHSGIDLPGIARAALTNLRNMGTGRRPVGASTITQQVAQNFLFTKEVSLRRKIREAIVALRLERAYSKEHILELYLNEIYLGLGSYGVAAAAINYFGKSLDELTVAEAAYLAALPKAPNNYHPVRHAEAAIERRNYVVGRMLEDGAITREVAEEARVATLTIAQSTADQFDEAAYFVEDVRRELAARQGENALYAGGLSVRTSVDPHLQDIANKALRDGLIVYDRRHGWRGAVAKLADTDDWRAALAKVPRPAGADGWQLAVVLDFAEDEAVIGLDDGTRGRISLAALKWARPTLPDQRVGPVVGKVADVLAARDVVLVEPATGDEEGAGGKSKDRYALRQVPDVDGALVAIDPHSGRVLAMAGGLDYARSKFNRATQAQRQPGSAFKPFVYMAALDAGFTPATVVLDAPFVLDLGPTIGKWKPANYTGEYLGPTPMRKGIEHSQNLMTVRIAQTIGMERVVDYAARFGVVDRMPPMLSMAIGAAETTTMRMTAAYAMIVNGGMRITPSLIDRIQDRHGRTIYRHDTRECPGCRTESFDDGPPPRLPDIRPQIVDPTTAYQMVSMLQGVVDRGTGRAIASIGKPLAGKTGTTNDDVDAWFVGFSPDLAVGVFVGFDQPRTLGRRETGSAVAVPIFRTFMAAALNDRPGVPFRVPSGIRFVRVDPDTGELAEPGQRNAIVEAFKPGTEPVPGAPARGAMPPGIGGAAIGTTGGQGVY
ncbi:MAG: penicillin-binding protein 1A [Alphaproteobacteria bacterium]|nr:penicillin-binding protein 1A [Alphaproteobacteria bacterium]